MGECDVIDNFYVFNVFRPTSQQQETRRSFEAGKREDKGKDLLVKCGFLVALWINAVLEEMVALIMTVV